MIICILFYSILVIGILLILTQVFLDRKLDKWRQKKKRYGPPREEFDYIHLKYVMIGGEGYNEKLFKQAEKKYNFYNKLTGFDTFKFIGIMATIFGGLLSFILSMVCLSQNFGYKSNVEYLKTCMERETIVSVLREDDTNPIIYQNKLDFNQKMLQIKMNYENPWLNWFENHKIAEEIDFIE